MLNNSIISLYEIQITITAEFAFTRLWTCIINEKTIFLSIMIFSKPMSYAIRALVHLAINAQDVAVMSSSIAEAESLPKPYLSKVLTVLKTAGYVEGTKGPNGGFRLAREAKDIRLFDLFALFEGLALTDICLLDMGKCGNVANCPVHDKWAITKNHLESYLRDTKIAEIASQQAELKKNR